jgi:heptosyltransferase-2
VIPPDHTRVARLVIRPPNWLGDAVLALPAMVALRRHFASASMTVAATSAVAALFREETGVKPDDVLVLPKSEREAERAIRDGRFELGILFPNSFRSAWQLRRAGVPQRWGYSNLPRGWMLTRKASAGKLQHHAEFYKNLVRGLGIPCEDETPSVTASPQALRQAEKQIGLESLDGARIITLATHPRPRCDVCARWCRT